MPKVHFVKVARKDNPVVKKGESYYWWQFRYGGKRYSTTPPRASQLTQSEFLSTALALQETIEDIKPAGIFSMEDLEVLVEEWKGEIENLRDMSQDSFDNMPENLQYTSENGDRLLNRVEAMEEWFNELDNLNLEVDTDADEDEAEQIQAAIEEIQNICVDFE